MSRSYKKYPIYTDGRPSEVKKAKRLANKDMPKTQIVKDEMTIKKYLALMKSMIINEYGHGMKQKKNIIGIMNTGKNFTPTQKISIDSGEDTIEINKRRKK